MGAVLDDKAVFSITDKRGHCIYVPGAVAGRLFPGTFVMGRRRKWNFKGPCHLAEVTRNGPYEDSCPCLQWLTDYTRGDLNRAGR